MTPEQIKKLRLRLGYSQAEFAKLINTHPNSVYNWEAGKQKPSGATMAFLLHLKDCSKTKV